jgi:prepilin-type N-terminal cleavage/methylation domain-containing protein
LSGRRSSGFTLIEIVLVLAIAGLILVAVFLALQGAQRTRRDHERKQDLAEVVAAVHLYAANHDGFPPNNAAEATELQNLYLSSVKDPLSGQPYTYAFTFIDGPHDTVPPVGTILYQQGHWCNRGPQADLANPDNPIAGDVANKNRFVVWTGLEAGGQGGGTWYCLDSGD